MSAKPGADEIVEALEPSLGSVRELDEPHGLDQLVLLLVAREAPFKKARVALRRLQQDYVDWNDVRVSSAHELAEILRPAHGEAAWRRAEELLDVLSTLYLRFNKMAVDVTPRPDQPPDDVKRRQKLVAYLTDKSSLYGALMPMHGSTADEVAASSELTRVVGRLGWTEGRASDSAARDAVFRRAKPGRRVAVQFALHQLAARWCVAKSPLCDQCAISAMCPSAKLSAPEPTAPKKRPAKKKALKAK